MPGHILLITGPNMGGKSTYLRQNALIVVLAQMGSFVPAKEAHIGIVDRLFSRVGAADDLARGRSTFMVEMVETAAILNQATARSLVILDEIGRGTATFDGLSIAWAAIEHLHEANRCRALFATHFHELTALAERLPRLSNATLKVTEWNGEVVFLHEVVPGAADRSYGLQVARLAGLPPPVVERAKTILSELEKSDREAPKRALVDDLPLFCRRQRRAETAPAPKPDALRDALDALDPDADDAARGARCALPAQGAEIAGTGQESCGLRSSAVCAEREEGHRSLVLRLARLTGRYIGKRLADAALRIGLGDHAPGAREILRDALGIGRHEQHGDLMLAPSDGAPRRRRSAHRPDGCRRRRDRV